MCTYINQTKEPDASDFSDCSSCQFGWLVWPRVPISSDCASFVLQRNPPEPCYACSCAATLGQPPDPAPAVMIDLVDVPHDQQDTLPWEPNEATFDVFKEFNLTEPKNDHNLAAFQQHDESTVAGKEPEPVTHTPVGLEPDPWTLPYMFFSTSSHSGPNLSFRIRFRQL